MPPLMISGPGSAYIFFVAILTRENRWQKLGGMASVSAIIFVANLSARLANLFEKERGKRLEE